MSSRSSRSSRLFAPRITSTAPPGVAVDVEGAEPLRDVGLGDAEALLRDHEVPPVRLQARRRCCAELDVRQVVGLDRVGEARVHLLDLGEDRLRLLALRADRGIGGRRAGADDRSDARPRVVSAEEREACRVSGVLHAMRLVPTDRPADGGVTGHKCGSLAAVHRRLHDAR